MSYVPNTDRDRQAMLAAIGIADIAELFEDIPEELRKPKLNLPKAASEIELRRELTRLAEENMDLDHASSFLGAGLYRHYVPAVVPHILSRGEFYTSYTPYQAEISQGVLQTSYEFQTLVCQLTGMDVANSSMYDGSTALAEAVLMAANVTGRGQVLVSGMIHPEHIDVLRTYTQGSSLDIRLVPPEWSQSDSTTAPVFESHLNRDVAAVVVQHPNFFGCIEDLAGLADAAHRVGALLIVSTDPIALGLLRPPGECGADIVVGEGQSLGNMPNYGGPLLGLFACRMEQVRKMPGRVVGRTTDRQGKQAFVLTLQTREQHIRREKATSNICTNEALNALAATVYLTVLGPQGLREVARLCTHKAHYAARRICAIPGFELAFKAPFFKEFVVRCPVPPESINGLLLEKGIVGGYELGERFPDMTDAMMFCVTELHAREEIDLLASSLEQIVAEKVPDLRKTLRDRAIGRSRPQ